jgi:hypothetical protein
MRLPILFAALACMAPSCGPQPTPQPPTPPPAPTPVHDAAPPAPSPTPPPAPPPPPQDDCEAQCAREHELNCPEWRMGCADDCRRADAELAKLGSQAPNHQCVAHAVSCASARACR